MVERRWAITRVVRPAMRRSRAPCTSLSDSLSKALVASSSRSTCSGIASHVLVIQAPCTRQTGVMHTLSDTLSNALVASSRSNTCSKVSTRNLPDRLSMTLCDPPLYILKLFCQAAAPCSRIKSHRQPLSAAAAAAIKLQSSQTYRQADRQTKR